MTTAQHVDQSWLGLILSDAPPESFEDNRLRELADAATEKGRRRVDAEALRAEQVRSLVVEHRRRAGELTALNDLALRLSGEHNLAALLQDTVTQARRVLDVDVAYLALNEPDGTLTINVTDGSIGSRLRGVRLQRDRSLAGRVVETSEPIQSTDYVRDLDFAHSDTVDQVAIEEGLRTIVGAPLRLRGDVIGVLMVAQRAVRRFNNGELSLLCSLGAFAGVAIDNARQMEGHRRVAEELSAVNGDLQHHVASVNRAAILHDSLLEVALRGGGVGQVIVSLSEVVGGLVLFVDDADTATTCACDGAVRAGSAVSPVDGLAPSLRFLDRQARRTWTSGPVVTVPVASANSYFGCIQVHPDGEITSWDLRLLERAAMTIALVAAAERAEIDAERRSAGELLEQLLAGRVADDSAFRRRALPLGLDLGVPHVVVVMDAGPDGLNAAHPLASLVRRCGGIAGRVAGRSVAAVPVTVEQVREALSKHGSALPGPVGLGGTALGAAAFAAAFDDALGCLHALLALDRHRGIAAPADLGPYRFVLSRAGRSDAQRFATATIGVLVEQDRSRHTDLVHTADVFLSTGRQHSTAATALHIHANTLYQRLDRITAALGDGWREGDRALDVQMALRIRRLLEVSEESGAATDHQDAPSPISR